MSYVFLYVSYVFLLCFLFMQVSQMSSYAYQISYVCLQLSSVFLVSSYMFPMYSYGFPHVSYVFLQLSYLLLISSYSFLYASNVFLHVLHVVDICHLVCRAKTYNHKSIAIIFYRWLVWLFEHSSAPRPTLDVLSGQNDFFTSSPASQTQDPQTIVKPQCLHVCVLKIKCQ